MTTALSASRISIIVTHTLPFRCRRLAGESCRLLPVLRAEVPDDTTDRPVLVRALRANEVEQFGLPVLHPIGRRELFRHTSIVRTTLSKLGPDRVGETMTPLQVWEFVGHLKT